VSGATQVLQYDRVRAVHDRLTALARGLPNDDLLACMLATRACGGGALPADLGLGPDTCRDLLARHFPGADWPSSSLPDGVDPQRQPERDELYRLLLAHRAGIDVSESWVAQVVAAGCMGSDHLWQDLGLWSRRDLSDLMAINFPELAARNDRNMKWKKFLYKQLCVQEGIYTCRAPSCEVCADYVQCFGPDG
jgi:nitrogen fixation protein NifQ